MASIFHGLVDAMDGVVDIVNAEAFSFRPMRAPKNGTPEADPDRAVVPLVEATFFDPAVEMEISPRRGGVERMQSRDSSQPQISVLAKLLPQGVRNGDRFVRAETGKTYKVDRIAPDDAGRLFLAVIEA